LNGEYCFANQTDAMKKDTKFRLSHNNNSERPFAIAKWLRDFFPMMSIQTIEGLVLAAQNKTFARSYKVKKSAYQEAGVMKGYFWRQAPVVQEAIRLASKDKRYKLLKKERFRLAEEAVEHRLELKREAQQKKAEKKALRAVTAFAAATRIVTLKALKSALKNKNIGQTKKILLDQIKLRKQGYGFVYDFPVKQNATSLKNLLSKMIKVERTRAGKKKYKTPTEVYTGDIYKLKVGVLGTKTKTRMEVEKDLLVKAEELILNEDDEELLQYEHLYLQRVFFDHEEEWGNGNKGRTRIIKAVEWSGEAWQVRTELCNNNGTEKKQGQNKSECPYLINQYLDDMFEYHKTNIEQNAIVF